MTSPKPFNAEAKARMPSAKYPSSLLTNIFITLKVSLSNIYRFLYEQSNLHSMFQILYCSWGSLKLSLKTPQLKKHQSILDQIDEKAKKAKKNPPFRKKLTAKASFTKKDNQNVLTESLNVDIDLQEENNSDILRFHRSNITPKIMKKLSRGTFSVQSELDLHGMTSNEASLVLKLFISESVQDGLTCVRVIHGKGLGSGPRGPVIKQQVNRLLRRWDQVLAFISARQVDGGTGAVYVLLKKSQ